MRCPRSVLLVGPASHPVRGRFVSPQPKGLKQFRLRAPVSHLCALLDCLFTLLYGVPPPAKAPGRRATAE